MTMLRRVCLLLFPLFSLTACIDNGGIEDRFVTYAGRLANVLEVDAPTPPTSFAITLEDKRQLYSELPRLSLGLLDSYELRDCGLFQIVAEKNSSLGKVWDQFQDFDYQLRLSDTLSRCLMSDSLSARLRAQLDDLAKIKQDHLSVHLRNLILTSDAMRKQLSGHQWLVEGQQSQWSEINSALSIFGQIGAAITADEPVTLLVYPYQEALERSPLIGALYYSLQRSTRWLNLTTDMLSKHISSIHCGPNRDQTRFNYLRNVFHEYYIKSIQAYNAELDAAYYQLNNHLPIIIAAFEEQNSAYRLQEAHQEFRQANLEHIQFWQQLFQRCQNPVQ
ncbi:DUF3080 family protein [Vibrio cidicii]|uniref:DUF3080 family protein n=1 Tax=Vibrio cidicii TaxID=1763883 RepID=UPI0018C2E5D2|nr:DUF3080 family protein [Vibrio cidicii]